MMGVNRKFLVRLLILNLIIPVFPIQYIGVCSASTGSEIRGQDLEGFIGFFMVKIREIFTSLKDFFSETADDEDVPPEDDILDEQTKQALAVKYAPVLYFHKDELWFPTGVDAMLDHSTLKELKLLRDEVKAGNPTLNDLIVYNSDDYYLKLNEYMRDWPFEQSRKVYARVFEAQDPGGGGELYLVIQYWFFYIGNDPTFWLEETPDNPFACNSHEGDWEMIQVIFDPGDKRDYLSWPPSETGYSQHYGGTRKSWGNTRRDGDHPVAYIARGSHASYHTQVDLEFKCDHAHADIRVGPEGYILHTLLDTSNDDIKWLNWRGHWGEYWSLLPYSSGPPGPRLRHSKHAYGLGGPAYYMWSDPINWQKKLDQG